MIYVNNEKIDKILSLKPEDICLVFDFDRTLTRGSSETSWSVIEKSDLINQEYIIQSRKLYDYYRKIEIDNSIDNNLKIKLMNEWIERQIELLSYYGVNERLFTKLTSGINKIKFRIGLDTFLKEINELNIPVIIISAGLGNIVKESLKQNNCLYENITIFSNMITFKNGNVEIDGNIINSINKDKITISDDVKNKFNSKNTLILFGDQISDLQVAQNFNIPNKFSIGFLSIDTNVFFEEYKQKFDIVCTECESFGNINKLLVKKDLNYVRRLERF